MSALTLERQFRRLLLILVELTCIGAMVELVLEKHYKELNQLIPFGLCIFAIVTVAGVLFRPGKVTINVMRLAMVLLITGSLLGMALHYHSNWEFETEMRPNAAITNVLLLSLQGAAPLLAPGLLALAGVLGITAVYYHPALGNRPDVTGEGVTV